MKATMLAVLIAVSVVWARPGVGVAQSAGSPFNGVWTLNHARSTFNSGTPPKREIATFKVTDTEEYLKAEIDNADGTRSVTEYTARFDGRPHPVKNLLTGQDAGTAQVKPIDARHDEKIGYRDGRLVSTIRREVSPDGRTFTSTITGPDGNVLSIRVFEKQ